MRAEDPEVNIAAIRIPPGEFNSPVPSKPRKPKPVSSFAGYKLVSASPLVDARLPVLLTARRAAVRSEPYCSFGFGVMTHDTWGFGPNFCR